MIRIVGLNSRTASIEARELFSFDAAGAEKALAAWRAAFPNVEAALLSTCNRTELYFASEKTELPDDATALTTILSVKMPETDAETLVVERADALHSFGEQDAAAHLFAVASSLDSMILGEPQILSQTKRAYELSSQAQTTGPILNAAFQKAFKTAKRVSVETEVFKRRVSVPSVAVVDFALNIFERLTDKKTLALGAGEMAEETLKYLADYGARSVAVSNRSRDKAEKLAAVWNATVVDWDARFDALADADLVIAATGAQEPVVKLDDYRRIEARRRGRPLFILDLSLPRNVEPSVGDRPNVYLYSIDDLEAACVRNREIRDRELPKALRLVDEEAARFMSEIESRRSIDAIRKLRDGWNEIKEAEVERLLRKIGGDPETQSEIRYAFDRLVNKLLHSPTTTLRTDAQSPSAPALLDAARRLFRI